MLIQSPQLRWIFLAVAVLVALLASYPSLFGFSKRFEIKPVEGGGKLLQAIAPDGSPRIRGRALIPPENPRIFENGVALPNPNSTEKHIRNGGFGRHAIKGREILLSTSDGHPVANRIYEVAWPRWSLPEGVLICLWIPAILALAMVWRSLPVITDKRTSAVAIAAMALLAGAFLFWPDAVASFFFDGLAVPAIWAALVGLLALGQWRWSFLATVIVSLFPLWAAHQEYFVEARSHASFIVGGVVPRSDAWVHFKQAVDIATQGGTEVFFNGRFLYPAFFGSLLGLSGANLSAGIFLSSLLVLFAMAIAARHVARELGWFTSSLLCLIVWLYYRNDGCGAVMSENLGLLAGLLALPFLLVGFRGDRFWLCCVAFFLIGFGFSARPGALFVLPALGLATGCLEFRRSAAWSKVVLAIVLAGGAGLAGLLSNSLMRDSLARGSQGVVFGNFAYSLHGLLHNTDWEESYTKYQGDSKKIMEINMGRLREDPMALVHGIGRAYRETFQRRFLFRFGLESRLAALGMIGFCAAGILPWFFPKWKKDAPWLTAGCLGVLASIPFAPPWDASVRPYAVTIPIQGLLAGVGLCMIAWAVGRVLPKSRATGSEKSQGTTLLWPASGIAILVLVFTFAVPPFLRVNVPRPVGSETVFLPGSSVIVSSGSSNPVGGVEEKNFRRGLSILLASYPEEAEQFSNTPDHFRFGIRSPDFEVAVVEIPGLPEVSK